MVTVGDDSKCQDSHLIPSKSKTVDCRKILTNSSFHKYSCVYVFIAFASTSENIETSRQNGNFAHLCLN